MEIESKIEKSTNCYNQDRFPNNYSDIQKEKTMPKRMTLKFNQKGLYRLLVTIFWVMICCVFSSLIHAQSAEVQGFSLQSAQEFAVEHSYDIKRSQMDILTAEKKVR